MRTKARQYVFSSFTPRVVWLCAALVAALMLVVAPDAYADENENGFTIIENPTAEDLARLHEDSEEEKRQQQEEAEKQRKIAEANQVYETAYASAQSAAGMLGGMGELTLGLEPYFEQLQTTWDEIKDINKELDQLNTKRLGVVTKRKGKVQQRVEVDKERAEALYGLLLTDKEIAHTEGVGIVSVLVGANDATAAETSGYLLERIASAHAESVAQAEEELANLDAQIAELEKSLEELEASIKKVEGKKEEANKALEDLVEQGNAAAFAIEKLASEARQESKEAITLVEDLDSEIEGVPELKASASSWDVRSYASRSEALSEAGAWYDAVDALVSLEGAISYGCGLDWALEKDTFVEKWGAAIDAFYASQGAPLKGHGKDMARQAYKYKVDPRLCAAVSIVESSGGRYCIKPHNAWGWGAADSDPYNLASGWGSWEEAIEAWHKGMATSQTGLATTPSLTAMGDIYCSTPIWGSKVATLMEQISSFASQEESVDYSAPAIQGAAAQKSPSGKAISASSSSSSAKKESTQANKKRLPKAQ